jgi:putative nucleotidyltransferase with HDIG domain
VTGPCHAQGRAEPEAQALAERLLAFELPKRWRHVRAVAAEAHRLCAEVRVVSSAVIAAAWLHDIGYAPDLAVTGFHPLDGARYLRAAGWDDPVCRLVAHHSDAAWQAPLQELGDQLRSEFPDVIGLTRDVLWTADVTTGPEGQRFTLDERVAEIGQRYGADHPVTRRMLASRTLLEASIARVAEACQ